MAALRLVDVACPGCGAGLEIDLKSEIVLCEYCQKSSFVHRPRDAVTAPSRAQQHYGHIHIPAAAIRKVRTALILSMLLPLAAVLVVVGIVGGVTTRSVRRPSPVAASAPSLPASAGALCAKVARCCRIIQPGNAGCDGMLMLSEAACAPQLEQLRTAATMLGRACP